MKELIEMGKKAKQASGQLANLNTEQKNKVLLLVADLLGKQVETILTANAIDLNMGREIEEMKKCPNGLLIGKKRVPLGVVGAQNTWT